MAKRLSEQRARTVARELLGFRGWDVRPVASGGQMLEESEYRAYPSLVNLFQGKSKTGPGIGRPDFMLVDSPRGLRPLIVIDTKASVSDLPKSVKDTAHYGDALLEAGRETLSVAVAGAESEVCAVRVLRKVKANWRDLTLHERAINWIPSPAQTKKILSLKGSTEVAPERPPDHVLAQQAERLNEILRECKIKDEFRPIYAATFMLAVWFGNVSTEPSIVLEQVNANARLALQSAQKPALSQSLRVDAENQALAERAWEIVDILEKLSIRSFLQEHDYLGQLYETFFTHTGGNTIGQYFTPRHVVDMMCELVDVTPNDVIFDPACGTGGFLIGALRRMVRMENLDYEQAIEKVRHNIYGTESEPTTAALCVTNMILRGDGKSGVVRADCFASTDFPKVPVDIALLNPPFPHNPKTDRPATDFIDRAMLSLRNKGIVASVVPYSLLVNTGEWHQRVLRENKLLFVATMPPDLFNPYASMNTAVVVLQKGTPHRDSRVFFAKLANDGYKLKKNRRVPLAGSQIPELLKAYSRKKAIAEFSAHAVVTADSSEWSPEAFIENAMHTDSEFILGFEDHMRAHAAFYVAFGYKLLHPNESSGTSSPRAFSGESTLSFSGLNMGPFNLSDYFTVVLGGKEEIEDLGDDGKTPIVTTSEFNNGVTAWKRAVRTYSPTAITVATDGSTCSSFVQEFPFYAFYKVAILRPKNGIEIPADAMYYIAYLLRRERWRYVYARKFGKGRLNSTVLVAPLMSSGEPDFLAMAKLAQETAAYPVVASFREAYKRSMGRWFSELCVQWKQEAPRNATVRAMASHPAYQQIISFGLPVVPCILRELAQNIDHWFVALHAITGENPVPESDHGNLDAMAKAWLAWGKKRGYR